jgi:hypothetical protein
MRQSIQSPLMSESVLVSRLDHPFMFTFHLPLAIVRKQ